MGRIRKGGKMGRPRKGSYDQIAELYHKGLSAAAIARLVGVHHTTALYALETMGLDTSPAARRERFTSISALRRAEALAEREARDMRDRELCRTYQDEGLSTVQIAAKTGIPRGTIFDALKRHGIQRREAKVTVRAVRPGNSYRKAREQFLQACKLKEDARIERMMVIVSKKASRFAA